MDDEVCPNTKEAVDVEAGEVGTHCEHWWDGEPCCWCKSPAAEYVNADGEDIR